MSSTKTGTITCAHQCVTESKLNEKKVEGWWGGGGQEDGIPLYIVECNDQYIETGAK
jgi:hypothetical protein